MRRSQAREDCYVEKLAATKGTQRGKGYARGRQKYRTDASYDKTTGDYSSSLTRSVDEVSAVGN